MVTSDSQASILIIDDEPDVCALLKDALHGEKLACTTVSDSLQAEAVLREKPFDVVICDIVLPGKSGLELLPQINRLCPNTKTILITANRRTDWAQEALRQGAFDYLEKPFEMELLRSTVKKALQLQRAEQYYHDPRQLAQRHCFVLAESNGTLRYVDGNFAVLTGSSPTAAVGRRFEQVFSIPDVSFEQLVQQAGLSRRVTANLCRAAGAPFQAELTIEAAHLTNDDIAYVVRIVDVSPVNDEGDLAAIIKHRRPKVGRDSLTGLPNHSSFQEELTRLRYQCRRHGRSVSVLLLNLDDLRNLNATHGFGAGDAVVIELADLIRRQVRMSDYVARYCGDQIVVIMPETDGRAAVTLAEELGAAITAHDCAVGETKLDLQVSIGVAECQSGFIENQSELLANAEEALLVARSPQHRPVVLWQPGMKLQQLDQATPSHSEGNDAGASSAVGTGIDRQLRTAYMSLAQSLVAAVEAKDHFTKDHSLNVAEYAEHFARCLGQPEEQIGIIRCAATLHDVGKIGIPDAILVKPGRLTEQEFEEMKRHPIIGAEIVGQSSFLSEEALLVRHHHERYDGSGYPDGVSGSELSVGARILQVADSLDTMICARFYKTAYSLEKILEELTVNSGTQFDPEIARLACELILKQPERLNFSEGSPSPKKEPQSCPSLSAPVGATPLDNI